jgi:Domain of unknown function (DUF4386)
MSTTVNHDTTSGYGGRDDVSRRGTKRVSIGDTDRRTATIVGVLFIIGTVAGILSVVVTGGFSMDAPAYLNKAASDPSQIQLGALLVLVMGLALAMVAAMMFPILKRQNEALAIGYVIFRGALETSAYMALAICWLLLVVVAGQHADPGAVASQSPRPGILLVDARDQIAAVLDIVFSLGALMLYYVLYRARLIPRWISAWGIVAAVLYLAGGLIDMFGTARDILSTPMLPQEMVMAVWLIAKGFSPSTIASGSDQQPLAG